MSFTNVNGKIIESSSAAVPAQNRGLRYGDGLFETLLSYDGILVHWEEHMERLWHGMQQLQFDIPSPFTKDLLREELIRLLQKNKHTKGRARVRINIVRGNGGLFDPENLYPHYIIETWALNGKYELNSYGLQLGIYRDAYKTCDSFSNLKHNNFLPYSMGALFAKANKFNDAVILNQHGRISDTCIANIFLIKDAEIFTPALSEGCIAGIMRNILLKKLPEAGYKLHETAVTIEALLNADEVFLTNSISPVKWASSLQDKSYSNQQILHIYNRLPGLLPEYFQ